MTKVDSASGVDLDERILDPCLLRTLLSDKTTGRNLRWGTDAYTSLGPEYGPDKEMLTKLVKTRPDVIRPRAVKPLNERIRRTRDKGEVFTPSWICNEQNNAVDEAWFGRDDVFNFQRERQWIPTRRRVVFTGSKTWKKYVDNRVLEISCGEAPYLVSRYDAVTGTSIPIRHRIGLLDRKLRIVGENASSDEEWLMWALRAFESSYGYDYQGDNVLLARENLLRTYIDYFRERFGADPRVGRLRPVANVIAWNIWQMDGFDCTVPYSFTETKNPHMQGYLPGLELEQNELPLLVPVKAKIYDWRARKPETFESTLKRKTR